MAMTRDEIDALDRKLAGINTPGAYGEGMAALDRAVGNPVASYSLDDLRRMFLRGSAPAPVPAATPGAMPAMTGAMQPPTSDAIAGPALPGPVSAAPMPPPVAASVGTRPTAPTRPALDPRAARELAANPVSAGAAVPALASIQAETPPASAVMPMGAVQPGEADARNLRLNAQQMARALSRYGRMEMDPTSFAARFARTQR